MRDVEEYLVAREAESIEELKEFCRIPSVSTDPAFRDGITAAANFLAERLKRAGFPVVDVVKTGGHPTVIAEWCETPSAPTILVYGHYDVQPPDPLDKWETPPFEPTIRDDRLYARGVSDDKGPLMIPILVAEAFRERRGGLPINLKMIVEGEEESGSPHFEPLVERLKDRLAADLVVSADGAMWRADLPSVTVASRGLVALDVELSGAAKDLHSGRHGGSAPNPIRALVRMLASLHDENGDIAVEGFHDGVIPPDPAIATAIRAAHFDPALYFESIGALAPSPLPTGEELLHRQWMRPTLEFNGVTAGYGGPGTKTVIPSVAGAKITCRLIAGQEPAKVVESIRRHLEAATPSGYRLTVVPRGTGNQAFALDPDLPALKVAERLLENLLGAAPLRVAMGATIPIGGVFKKYLGIGTIFFSFSTADEDYHAPNEYFRMSSFRTGLIAWTRLFHQLAEESLSVRVARGTMGEAPRQGCERRI
ncbi:Acetylornithine deacetylase/Succinyl-diaminopimelate desuccinylase [Rhizobiales bacterium GAS191]|nr:Acetylornithine deacetylase/Succinyl-diaminopimelate desuccinylase [Rhizobiales bacterium GAS191]